MVNEAVKKVENYNCAFKVKGRRKRKMTSGQLVRMNVKQPINDIGNLQACCISDCFERVSRLRGQQLS